MLKNVTRSRLIQVWLAAVVLMVAVGVGSGVSVTVVTGAALLTLSLVPAAIVLLLWPGIQPQTAADVLRGENRRERDKSRR